MPEIYRKFDVHFSKAEIEAILSERARKLVLSRPEAKHVDVERVCHVEGEAIVTIVLTAGK
jgi:hypothetical protein